MVVTRRLYLLRHAQAGPARPGQSDYERVLDAQGEADARALGLRMARHDVRPALVLCSSSARTRGTLSCLGAAVGDAALRFDDRIYDEGEDGCLAALGEVAGDEGDIVLIGHNPSIGNLARRLPGSGSPAALETVARGFPTASLACLRRETGASWDGSFLESVWLAPHRAG